EQKVVLEEIKMYEDSPDELIHDVFLQTMWKGANLGEPTIGFADTVTEVTPDDLRAHMQAHYAPNSVVVAAAGNVDHDRFVELVAREFAAFDGSCALPAPESPVAMPATHVRSKDSEQAYVVVGTQGLSVRDERRYALSILDTILGGGMSSRLFQEIREKRGLVYSVYSFQAAYRAAGLFGVYAGTSPENVQACIDVIAEQFAAVRARPVGDGELNLAKEHIKGNLTLSLESSSSRMIRLGRNEFALGRDVSPEEIEQRIDAVTAEEVRELAGELLSDERLGLCIIGPVDESTIAWNRDAA
ncbi:MAG TPA: pitrilysin family protein, partial [Candidatus Acidoferrales bacterium]|nr:pitrilysin family protein [Candidatus Acidoferrales bacterium]